jgi:hypothetical protein
MSGVVPRSQRLFAFEATFAGDNRAWTCPGGFVTLVKSVHIYNPTAAPGGANIWYALSDTPSPVYVLRLDLAAAASYNWQGFDAINPGDAVVIQLWVTTMTALVTGAVLAGPPQFPPSVERLPSVKPNS